MRLLTISIQHSEFTLHPYGGLWWRDHKMLLIADPHFGKVSDFRKNGLAVPSMARKANYQKLNELIAHFVPEHLVYLGDLFHHNQNQEFHEFVSWSINQSFRQTLVLGNHDRYVSKYLIETPLVLEKEMVIDGFSLTHHPSTSRDQFNICGHVHPSLLLRGKGGLSAKSACFVQKENQLILPAFGAFTGSHKIRLSDYLHVYMNAEKEVIQVK